MIEGQTRDLLVGLVAMGCSRRQAARYSGVGPRTLFYALKEDPTLAEQVRRAEMQQNVNPLQKIREHAETSWRAAVWLAERQESNKLHRSPMMVSKADCMSFLRAVVGSFLKDLDSQDQQRAAQMLQKLDRLMQGYGTTPRGRRFVKELLTKEGISCSGAESATNATNRTRIFKNAGFEQGEGI